MKKALFYTAVIAVIIFTLADAAEVIRYSKAAMNMCYEFIIPTLFPFFVCSGLLIYSGFGSFMAKVCSGFMRPVFNVAPAGAAAFVLGIISGFPSGAVTAVQLYECHSISKTEAERLLSFCNNSGPLFIVGSVGAAFYGRPVYGIVLYCLHIAASVICGIIFGFYGRKKHNAPDLRLNTEEIPLTRVMAEALQNASKSIITVCFSIIFFSAVTQAVLSKLVMPPIFDAVVSGIFEFSTGTLKTAALDYGECEKLVITSFIIGFSGLCVHFQVMSVTAKSGLSLKPYILGKLLHGTLAAILTAAVFKGFIKTQSVYSEGVPVIYASFTVIPLLFAATAAIVFILRLLICLRKQS